MCIVSTLVLGASAISEYKSFNRSRIVDHIIKTFIMLRVSMNLTIKTVIFDFQL